MIGGGVVLVYTIFGGMWSVAITDLFQTVVILIGLSLVAWMVGDLAGGADVVVSRAIADGKLVVPRGYRCGDPLGDGRGVFCVAFGSIPQQDVFQRMTSAKDDTTAVRGTIIGALICFCFAFVPIFIAYSALVADPSLAGLFDSDDARAIQQILPDIVLGKMPVWAQILFLARCCPRFYRQLAVRCWRQRRHSPRTSCGRSSRT